MRVVHVERAADDALRSLRRLESVAERGGFLMLAMASSAAVLEFEDAREHELAFRRDLPERPL